MVGKNYLWIPIEQGCGALLVAKARSGGSCYARRHFLRARLRWSLRKRLTVGGGIPAGLLAVVLAIVVDVPM